MAFIAIERGLKFEKGLLFIIDGSKGIKKAIEQRFSGYAVIHSLSTTNCIEALMAQMGSYTDKVDRWHNSDQILRWTATACMDIEPRLNRIRGHRYLNVLRNKLLEIVGGRSGEKSSVSVREVIEIK